MKKNKKISRCYGLITTFLLLSLLAHSQYISIEGRQFKKNGHDFYPVVCNYNFMPVYNSGSTNYYLSRINGYGPGDPTSWNPMPNYEFECTDQTSAYAEILADFTKIHDMGFNCIRTAGFAPSKCDTDSVGIVGFYLRCFRNRIPLDDTTGGATRKVNIYPPYSTDSILLNFYFPSVDLILQAARICSLKVILDCVYDDIAMDANGVDAADYAAYLSVLANRYKNDTTLFAYVTIEEPEWSHQGGLQKEKVCEYSTLWYDAINSTDTNHLVTVGGCGYWGVFYWDLSTIKMDFYSTHTYPYNMLYENYSVDTLFDRWKGALLWMHKNCPTPWIIGETGFTATDDNYFWDGGNWIRHTFLAPATNGNLTQQADYVQNSLDAVRDLGGSGYSWWNYQENWWGPWEEGYGLLRHGELDTIDKPAVSVFENYPSPPPAPGTFINPPNYYDPLSWEDKSPGYPKTLSGTITETSTTNTIEDAYIVAFVKFQMINNGPIDSSKYNYTFSHPNGSYSLNPKYPNSYLFSSDYRFIGITASGASDIWPGKPLAPYNNHDYSLIYRSFKYDNIVSNETISTSRNFQGWSTLTASNITIQNGGSSEFKARDEVTINGNFTVNLGGEAYIYCTETFPECNSYQGMKMMNTNSSASDDTLSENSDFDKQIDVKFIPVNKYAYLDVYPNPGNGIFILNLRTNKETNSLMQVNIYDITGSCVYKSTVNENLTNLDLTFLSKGIYYLHVSTNEDSFNQKLIIR